jgi:hypothetical protein
LALAGLPIKLPVHYLILGTEQNLTNEAFTLEIARNGQVRKGCNKVAELPNRLE